MRTHLERAHDIVAGQQRAQAAHAARYRGRDGDVEGGWRVETVEACAARLEADTARALAFRRTPLGRFLTAVDELDQGGGYADEALRLRGYYSRSLADDREPVDMGAVAACLRILAGINVRSARDGIAALADVMVERGIAA